MAMLIEVGKDPTHVVGGAAQRWVRRHGRWSAAAQRGEGGGFRPGMVREAECGGAVRGMEPRCGGTVMELECGSADLKRKGVDWWEKIGDFSG